MHLVTDGKRRQHTRRKSLMGQMVLILLGVQTAFFASFTSLDLPTATGGNLMNALHKEARKLALLAPEHVQSKIQQFVPSLLEQPKEPRYSSYTPLAPVAILLGYVLGPRLAAISAVLFILLGLGGNFFNIYPFASGGGARYYLEPGFGYLLGMIASATLCGFLTANKRTSISQLLGIALGLLVLHLTGIGYLIGSYLYFYIIEGSKSYVEWQQWIFPYLRNLSWYALPYDVIFAFLVVGIGFPFRWLVNTLTAPDIAPPRKRIRYNRKVLEELVN